MPVPAFDPASLSKYATDRSIRRGEDYFGSGAVGTLVLRGDNWKPMSKATRPVPTGCGSNSTPGA